MHLIFIPIVLFLRLLQSCGESKEKPRPEYGIENLKFGFSDNNENDDLYKLSYFSGRWLELERFQYTETSVSDDPNTVGRLVFLNLNKINGKPGSSHCASERDNSDLSSEVMRPVKNDLHLG